jgi:hypothetical protein
MGDAGEGLIDADSRIQERMEELERSRAAHRVEVRNPEKVQALELLRLTRAEIERQIAATTHERRAPHPSEGNTMGRAASTAARAAGRNEPCPCGSGKKFKHCHGPKAGAMTPRQRLLLFAAVVVLAGMLALAFSTASPPDNAGRVWSPEHGHYH